MGHIINIIFWLWSHSPVLSLSDDDNFANLEIQNLKEGHLRFSLINIMLGDKIFYLITFDIKQRKFKLLYEISLEDMPCNRISDQQIKEIQERYREHLNNISSDDIEVERESLCYHINSEEQRIDSSITKINMYTTIMLTVLPLLLAFFDFKIVTILPIWLKICFALIVYSLINICKYIFRSIKVRKISKSSFKDLRNSENKAKEINIQYQYDWQQLKFKAQLFVSFVLNLQEWVIFVLIIAIFFSISLSKLNMKTEDPVLTVDIHKIQEPNGNSTSSMRIYR